MKKMKYNITWKKNRSKYIPNNVIFLYINGKNSEWFISLHNDGLYYAYPKSIKNMDYASTYKDLSLAKYDVLNAAILVEYEFIDG